MAGQRGLWEWCGSERPPVSYCSPWDKTSDEKRLQQGKVYSGSRSEAREVAEAGLSDRRSRCTHSEETREIRVPSWASPAHSVLKHSPWDSIAHSWGHSSPFKDPSLDAPSQTHPRFASWLILSPVKLTTNTKDYRPQLLLHQLATS